MSCIFLACYGVPGAKSSNSYSRSLTYYETKVKTSAYEIMIELVHLMI